jgi:hypothetical protein
MEAFRLQLAMWPVRFLMLTGCEHSFFPLHKEEIGWVFNIFAETKSDFSHTQRLSISHLNLQMAHGAW